MRSNYTIHTGSRIKSGMTMEGLKHSFISDAARLMNEPLKKTNYSRRLKQHVSGPLHDCLAVVPPGFEAVCRDELAGVSETLRVLDVAKGAVFFKAKLADILAANLWVRTANRFLMRMAGFKATNFRQLEKQAGEIAWELYLPPGTVPDIKTTSHHSRLYHTDAVRSRAGAAIEACWGKKHLPLDGESHQRLFIRLDNDRATFSLDSSGEPLYRRGLKTHAAAAPLRETLAAAILVTAGFRPDRPLVDPMCGAGTFSLEAAMMAKQMAPGLRRDFAFTHWPAFPENAWRHMNAKAAGRVRTLDAPLIVASDVDPLACDRLSACIRENRLDDAVTTRQQDFFDYSAAGLPPGLVVLNPPYGLRLTSGSDTRSFYKRISAKLRQSFSGWRAGVILPQRSLADLFTYFHGSNQAAFEHGGLKLWLLSGNIP